MRESLLSSFSMYTKIVNSVTQLSTVSGRKAILPLVYRLDCILKRGCCIIHFFFLYVPIMVFLYVALNLSTEYEFGNCLTPSLTFLMFCSAFHLSFEFYSTDCQALL